MNSLLANRFFSTLAEQEIVSLVRLHSKNGAKLQKKSHMGLFFCIIKLRKCNTPGQSERNHAFCAVITDLLLASIGQNDGKLTRLQQAREITLPGSNGELAGLVIP